LQAIFKFPKAKNDLIESIKTFDDDEIEYFGGREKDKNFTKLPIR
jgi:hypothetical protein